MLEACTEKNFQIQNIHRTAAMGQNARWPMVPGGQFQFHVRDLTSPKSARYLRLIEAKQPFREQNLPVQRLITFTTDFGLTEHYVGVMKGVIYGINPSARIVDVTNAVQSFDVLDGAIAISQAYSYFPKDTIHVVVVDPGVGGPRRPILAHAGQYTFLAPDNGVLSLVFEREERVTVRHVTSEHYFHQPVSNTFHGRDVFAPVAAYLSKGVDSAKFGDEISDFTRFAAPKPKAISPNNWKAVVLKSDKFGNLITNITAKDIPEIFDGGAKPFKITVGKSEITKLSSTYSDGAQGELIAVMGSTGFLEISTNKGPASRLAAADKGSEVSVTITG
jgi:S-adenosylmethionine hydrolase